MALPQEKFREIVFQLLYSYDLSYSTEEEMHALLTKELAVTKKNVREAQEKVNLIHQNQDEIDLLIGKASLSYTFERIQTVERNILRLGVFEILYDKEIPPKVAIAEALRLARKFGTPESATFVNAVLDSIYKTMMGETPSQSTVSSSIALLIESEEKAQEVSKSPPADLTSQDDDQ